MARRKALVGTIAGVEIRHRRGDDGFLVWWFDAKRGNAEYDFDIRGILAQLHGETGFTSSGMHEARNNGTVLAFIETAVNQFGVEKFWDWICEDGGYRYHNGISRSDWEAKQAACEKGD